MLIKTEVKSLRSPSVSQPASATNKRKYIFTRKQMWSLIFTYNTGQICNPWCSCCAWLQHTIGFFCLVQTVSKDLALWREQLYAALVLHWLLGSSLWPGQLCTAPVASNWGKHPLRPEKKGQNIDVPDTAKSDNRKLLNPRNSSSYECALPKLISWQIFWLTLMGPVQLHACH